MAGLQIFHPMTPTFVPKENSSSFGETLDVMKLNLSFLLVVFALGLTFAILLHGCGSAKKSGDGATINIVPSVPVLP